MRMQMPPSSALSDAEPVVYAPKAAFLSVRRLDGEEDASKTHPPGPSGVFPTWPAATKNHRQPKRDAFVCPEVHCGNQFPRSFALRRHMRIHTGTKPYECDFEGCAQRFNTSGNLSRHKRIHSGERPYPCCFDTCGKRFNTSTKLKRHMRIHFPDGQSLFRCTETACDWACDNYKEYVQHQKLHSSVAASTDENADINTNSRFKHSREFPQPSEDGYQQDRRLYLQRDDNDCRRSGGSALTSKLFMEDRSQPQAAPRLPFPTRAFPSETVTSGLLASSFHPLTHLPQTSHRYYDPASPGVSPGLITSSSSSYAAVGSYVSVQVPYSSYLRGGDPNGLVGSYQNASATTSFMSSSEPYTQNSMRQDVDRHYDSSSPNELRHQSPPQQGQSQSEYGSNGSSVNPVPAEFTGEELSAVLELMKDS